MTSRLLHISHQTTLPTTQKYGGGTVNHVMSADYDVNTGLMAHFTDQNSQTTNYAQIRGPELREEQKPAIRKDRDESRPLTIRRIPPTPLCYPGKLSPDRVIA